MRKTDRRNKSGHTGVCWHKGSGRWVAQISVDGRTRYLGGFEDAARAGEVFRKAEQLKADGQIGEIYRGSHALIG